MIQSCNAFPSFLSIPSPLPPSALSANGRLLVEILGQDKDKGGTIFRILEIETGREIHQFYLDVGVLSSGFQFDPRGEVLAVTYVVRPTVITTFYDVESGAILNTLYGYSHIAFHPHKSMTSTAKVASSPACFRKP